MKVTLTVIEGPHLGKVFEFDRHDTFIVGRAKSAQFRLSDDDEFFSRNHFLLEVNPPLCRIMDLCSTNGTRVNGKVVQSADLSHGDIVRGGKTKLRLSILKDDDEEQTPSPPTDGQATIVPRHIRKGNELRRDTALGESPQGFEQTLIPPNPKAPTRGKKSPTQPPEADLDVKAGSLPSFPGYQTVRELGKGGMGVVYEAISLGDESRVAIKVVLPHAAATPTDVSRFLREAMILKELQHPNIVRFRDLNQLRGELYIVMDFVTGQNADALIKLRKSPLSVPAAVSITCQLLDALQYAHERGYVHRDVKPANLMISTGILEQAFLADFGLSRAYHSSKLSGLTLTGDVGGSTPYMPPEQITKYRDVQPFADQYSAAATLYYLLTGKQVYNFPRDVSKQLLMILQDPIIPIDKRRSDLPESLTGVIHKALCRHPDGRFASAAQFSQALRDAIGSV